MAMVRVTDRDGSEHEIAYDDGEKLMEVLKAQDMVRGECGGMQICSTCHVLLSPEAYGIAGPATEDEVDLVDGTGEYRDGSSRLSCQIILSDAHDGIALTLGPDI